MWERIYKILNKLFAHAPLGVELLYWEWKYRTENYEEDSTWYGIKD